VQTIQPTVEVAKLTAAAPPVDLSGHGESVDDVLGTSAVAGFIIAGTPR